MNSSLKWRFFDERANCLVGRQRRKRVLPAFEVLVDTGLIVKWCCEVLEFSGDGYFLSRNRLMSPTKVSSEFFMEVEQLLMGRRRRLDAGPRD